MSDFNIRDFDDDPSIELPDKLKTADALLRKLGDKSKCLRPLGCDCPDCIKRFGPIHPGNVGKDLRSNPLGKVTNPRRG